MSNFEVVSLDVPSAINIYADYVGLLMSSVTTITKIANKIREETKGGRVQLVVFDESIYIC